MRVHLGGHLAWYDPHKRARFTVTVAEPVRLTELLARLGVPAAEVAVATVNGVVVELEPTWISDVDCVEVFPPVGGGASQVQGRDA